MRSNAAVKSDSRRSTLSLRVDEEVVVADVEEEPCADEIEGVAGAIESANIVERRLHVLHVHDNLLLTMLSFAASDNSVQIQWYGFEQPTQLIPGDREAVTFFLHLWQAFDDINANITPPQS
jgi:hypothetical protein